MINRTQILSCIRWSLQNIKGNISEKIIQNAMLYKLRSMGIECQQEVVLPVLAGNVFLGYNRFDIFVPENHAAHKTVVVLELKLLASSIQSKFLTSRVREQCLGYKDCAQRIFGDDTKVKVYVVNTWRVGGMKPAYKHEVLEVDAGPQKPRILVAVKKSSRIMKRKDKK